MLRILMVWAIMFIWGFLTYTFWNMAEPVVIKWVIAFFMIFNSGLIGAFCHHILTENDE